MKETHRTTPPALSRMRFLLPLVLGITATGVLYGRFLWQGRQSVRAAELAVAQGDRPEATRSYLDALRAYVPGSPFERRALDGLQAAAAAARRAGDVPGERRAWEAVRTGLLATRSLYLPYPTRFSEAQRHLAELDATAAFPPRQRPVPDLDMVPMRGNAPGRAVRPLGPAMASTVLALAGFAIWVAAIVLLIRGRIERHPGRAMAKASGKDVDAGPLRPLMLPLLFVVGFALFLLGLRFA